MLTRALLAAFAMTFAAAPPATAQSGRMFQALPPANCGTPLAATGKALAFKAPLDAASRSGLMAGLFLALRDPTGQGWSETDLKTAGRCPVARFAAGDAVWTLVSGAGSAPPRMAVAAGRRDGWFLVRGPSPSDAEAWSRTRRGLPEATTPHAYYLVSQTGHDPMFLYKVYDGPPAAALLADDIAAALEGDAEAIAAYTEEGGAVSLLLDTAAGARAELFRPASITVSAPASLFAPDGRLVTETGGGDWVLRGSGFACRSAHGAFQRIRVQVLDVRDEALDLACAWSTDESWTVLDVTFMPDKAKDKAYVAERIRQEEEAFGVTRRFSKLPTGRDSPVIAGRWWVDKEDVLQTMYVMRRGDYLFELRQGLPNRNEIESANEIGLALIDQVAAPGEAGQPSIDAWRSKR
ncbi:hypothetical protein [Phenylobacterium sp.]|uniref:hypothetical protein n=1 Tax=Phenylobacterium sp. TaxID=1871053 RepID=UPI0035B1602A